MRRHIVLFCGPRGAGKGTLVGEVLTSIPGFARITCHTTRPMRTGERDGDQYRFVPIDSFEDGVRRGEFVSWLRISPRQASGLTKQELLRHARGVTDVTPAVALSARVYAAAACGSVLIVGVTAPLGMRRERIRSREPDICESSVGRLLDEDPVSDADLRAACDVIIRNDRQGDIEHAASLVRRSVAEFLMGG